MSGSGSDCCDGCEPACEQWLTAFCEYETVTVSYCGTTTVFEKARSNDIPISEVNPNLSIHPADCVFRVSRAEHDVVVGVGATVLDSDDVEWHVYRAEWLSSFCVWKLWARSVSACYTLLETIDILTQECESCDCDGDPQFVLAARVKGSVAPISGTAQVVNDASMIRPRIIAMLTKWPLSEMPQPQNRIRHKDTVYRILSYTNNGPLIPFEMVVES